MGCGKLVSLMIEFGFEKIRHLFCIAVGFTDQEYSPARPYN